MNPFDWPALVQQILSRATELVFGAAGGFFAAWLAFRYGMKRDVTRLQAELTRELQKQRIENQSRVIDQLWKNIQAAIETASILTAMYKQYPDFRFLSGDALDEFLRTSFLSEAQKKELLQAPDRNKYYQKARFWHELNDARKALYELDALLRREKIYIPEEVAGITTDLVATLNGLFISYEIWHEGKEPQLMKKAREEIKQAQELVSKIEDGLRSIVTAPMSEPPSA